MNDTNIYVDIFGFGEMYEYLDESLNVTGRFVCFTDKDPEKIEVYPGKSDKMILGVSTIGLKTISDNPQEWPGKYLKNEFNDAYVKMEPLAVGTKEYDDVNERSFIMTRKASKYSPIVSGEYDENQEYVNRLKRKQWGKVALLGKAIITDNGKCKPGSFCTAYSGSKKELFGTAVPAKKDSAQKFYVISRYSDNTIKILLK